MSMRVGVIGYPIGHSVSPAFQQAALDYQSIDATYQAWEVEPGDVSRFVEGLRSRDALGVNVTVPHKEAVVAHLDAVDDWARDAGAVNTIVNSRGKLSGFNTDGAGFLRALEEDGHFSPEGCNALVIGAGGSAKAVALALARRGAASITIANRTLQRALVLAGVLEARGGHASGIPLEPARGLLARAAARCDLLVNCTTLGMRQSWGEEVSPIPAEYIPPSALVYDLVYNPPETPLLREAARAGAATLGGLPMLVYQGASSFELWTGKEAPVEVMLKVAREALEHFGRT